MVPVPATLRNGFHPEDGLENRANRENAAEDDLVTAAGPSFLLVSAAAQLPMVVSAVEGSVRVGLDLETTGLDPRKDRVRLLSLAVDTSEPGETFTYLLDVFQLDPRPLFEALAGVELVIHNAAFDLQFLARLGFVPGKVTDTLLLSQVLDGPHGGKGYHTLAGCVRRHLEQELSKDLQRSDWSGTLTAEQLAYAAGDAQVLRPLAAALEAKVTEAGMRDAAALELRALPAVVWTSGSGVGFDAGSWRTLAHEAAADAERLAKELDRAAPRPSQPDLLGGGWNWDSPEQVKQVFGALGVELASTDDDALAACPHPLAATVREYRSAGKRASTYGEGWVKGALAGDRLFAEWRQIGCITGRMAARSPNLQNLPGDVRYRRCFLAPPGRVLVKADYSQIELRIAAKMSGDRAMLGAYARGLDLHTLTARKMLGRDEVTPAERKLAKPVNFGLIYGLSARGLRAKAKAEYGLDLTAEQAEGYRQAFFAAYPGIARWHQQVRRARATETRTLTGRRAAVKADDFPGKKVNYMVQGTGGDGIKLALALLRERREQAPGAFPVLAVHDEIVVEAPADQADTVAAWLKQAMLDGMTGLLAPVPVEVEVQIGRTWGGDAV
jgi:DNA polymerase-1